MYAHCAHTQKDQKVEGQGWLGVIWGFWKGSYFDYKCPWRERGEEGEGTTGITRTNSHSVMCAHTHSIVLLCWPHWYMGAPWDARGVCGGLETSSHPWLRTGGRGGSGEVILSLGSYKEGQYCPWAHPLLSSSFAHSSCCSKPIGFLSSVEHKMKCLKECSRCSFSIYICHNWENVK